MASAIHAIGICPRLLLAADHAEGESADRERGDERAEPVEAPVAGRVARLRDVAQGEQRDEDERHVDEERCAPADRIDEDASGDRTEDHEGGGGRRPDPEGAGPLLALERVRDDRQRAGHEQRAGRSLEQAGDDQQLERRRESAHDGRHAEQGQPDPEDPAAPVMVGQRARQDEQRGEHRQVAADDVRLALEDAEDRGRQVAADPGQGHVHDRSVEEDDARPDDGRDERPALYEGHAVSEGPGRSMASAVGRRVGPGRGSVAARAVREQMRPAAVPAAGSLDFRDAWPRGARRRR